jgi:hypothetical protein
MAVIKPAAPTSAPSSSPKFSVRNWAWVLFILLVLAGAALGWLIIYWHSGKTQSSKQFAETNQFEAWEGLVAGLLALAVAVGSLTWSHALRLAKEASRGVVLSSVAGYLLICGAVIVVPFLTESGPTSFLLYGFRWRVMALSVAILIVSAGCFGGLMFLGAVQRESSRTTESGSVRDGDVIRALLRARTDLKRFLFGAAVLITGTVLMIGGLQNALNAYYNATINSIDGPANVVDISTTDLVLLGAFFAALLALVFIPAYLAWQEQATEIRDKLYEIPDNGRPSKEWYEDRSNLETLLEIRTGIFAKTLAALGILAPFIVSIVSSFLLPTARLG